MKVQAKLCPEGFTLGDKLNNYCKLQGYHPVQCSLRKQKRKKEEKKNARKKMKEQVLIKVQSNPVITNSHEYEIPAATKCFWIPGERP